MRLRAKHISWWVAAVLAVWFLLAAPSSGAARELVAAVPGHFPPQYVIGRDSISGFAIEVMDLVAARMGHTVRYVDMGSWEAAQSALRLGHADLIPNMGVTPRRETFADFSSPVETFPVSVFVRSEYDQIQGADDLAGHKVAVVKVNVGYRLVQSMDNVEPVLVNDRIDALFYLLAGQADALVYPEPLILLDARNSGLEDRLRVLKPPLLEIKRAIAVRKGDSELLADIEGVLPDIVASDDYKAVFQQWYGAPKPVNWRLYGLTVGAICLFFLIVFALYRLHAKRVRAGIQASEEQYRLLFARMMVGFSLSEVLTDAAGNPVDYRFLDVNERFEQMTGLRREDVVGRTLLETFFDLDPDWLKTFGRVARDRESAQFEGFYTPIGLDLDILIYSPRKGQIAVMFTDITARKRVERIKADVEHIMMHDLRAPLQGIIGLPALLREDGNLTEEQRDVLGHMEGAGQRMLHLMNLSLDLFKLETGSYDYHPQQVDPCGVIQEVADTVMQKARSAKVSLRLGMDNGDSFVCPSPAQVWADPVLLHTVALNLVTNAVEASSEGGEVGVSLRSDPGSHQIVISNQGVVPEAVRRRFFEKYATHGKRSGTGLGTYSAKLMTEAMGGSIGMETSQEHGTVVTVALPRSPDVAPDA